METTTNFIDGQEVAAGDVYDNIDPASGRPLGSVARSGENEVDRAVQTAAHAQKDWAATLPEHRSRLLHRIADLVDRDREQLARAESEDTGKPLSQARTDGSVCARYFRFYGSAVDTYYGLQVRWPRTSSSTPARSRSASSARSSRGTTRCN